MDISRNVTAYSSSERNWFLAASEVRPFIRNYMWFVCSFGLPGNVLIVWLIHKMKTRGMASYMIVYLAIFDSLALVAKLVQRQIFYSDLRIGNIGCKLVSIPEMTCASTANWTLVLISFERFLTICYPLKRQRLLTDWRIKAILVALPLLLFTYVTTLNITFQIESKAKCGTRYLKFFEYMVIPPSTNIITPFVLLLIFTICVVMSIKSDSKKRSKRLKSVTSIKDNKQNSQTATQEMEKTLINLMLAAAALYFMVNALYSVYTLIMFPIFYGNIPSSVMVTRFAAMMISDWNHALNFYVYTVFSRGFRENLIKTLKAWRVACRRSCGWRGTLTVSDGRDTKDNIEMASSSSVVLS